VQGIGDIRMHRIEDNNDLMLAVEMALQFKIAASPRKRK
jgi:hypothetical protein